MKNKILIFFPILFVFSIRLTLSDTPVLMKTYESDYFCLHYTTGLEADATQVRTYFEHAVKAMLAEFAKYDPETLLKTAECNVYLYAKPNKKVSESQALIESGMNKGKYYATIYFLSPSAHSKNARTNMGEPKDANYFFKTVVHEYSTIILERLTSKKAKGWKFFSAPSWFVQGYEDYLGLMNSSEHSRRISFPKYIEKLRGSPERISFDSRIIVENSYIDGTILLAFMHDTYGKEKIQSILLSEQETFDDAMWHELGEDLPGFANKFNKWKQQKMKLLR